MYYVYILQSLKDGKSYVGHTNNFYRRFKEHQSGQSLATKHRRPFKLLILERFQNLRDAKHRESYWKNGGGRRKLKELFKN